MNLNNDYYVNMSDSSTEVHFKLPKAVDTNVNDTIKFSIQERPTYL